MKKLSALMTLIIIGLLWILNPDENDFSAYVAERMQEKLTLSSSLDLNQNELLLEGIEKFSKGLNNSISHKKNYVLCSVHELRIGNQRYRYFGIAKTFIPLDEKNSQ
jgi:hypothetical protein